MKKKQTHDQGHHFQTKLLKTVFIIYFKTSNTTMCIKTHMVRSKVFCVDIPMMEFVHCILHARWFRCLLLCLCLIFSALINFLSLCCSKLSNQETIYCLKEKKEKKSIFGFLNVNDVKKFIQKSNSSKFILKSTEVKVTDFNIFLVHQATPEQVIHNLIQSMPRRCHAVDSQGGHAPYPSSWPSVAKCWLTNSFHGWQECWNCQLGPESTAKWNLTNPDFLFHFRISVTLKKKKPQTYVCFFFRTA